jgi:hypothetical protein
MQRIRQEYGAGSLPAGTTDAGDEPPLELIDRSDTERENGRRSQTGELTDANIVSIASVDEETQPTGTEYDHDIDLVCGVRIEGLHHSEWGHIDSEGRNGVPWRSLVRLVRRAILRERTFPAVGTPDTAYTALKLANGADQSSNYADYYRYDCDVIFSGYETLP